MSIIKNFKEFNTINEASISENVLHNIEKILNDRNLIKSDVSDFSIKYFPKAYKNGEKLTVVLTNGNNEDHYDMTINTFVKWLEEDNLVKNSEELKRQLEDTLQAVID